MHLNIRKSPMWSPVILILLASATFIELVMLGADLGLWGSARLRLVVYQNTAFWPGLLGGWIPNYASQPFLMFLTYAFVHSGFIHLLVNMITLVSLGGTVIKDVGQVRFLIIYAVASLTGAMIFVMLTTSFRPMVGASGALFGLAGALVLWNISHAFQQNISAAEKVVTFIWPIGVLILLNLLMYFGFEKGVAWETHLGGFLGGFFTAMFMQPSSDDGDHPSGSR